MRLATEDHKPSLEGEKVRIEAAGGKVAPSIFGGPDRVDGGLSVSRGFGAFDFKDRRLSAEERRVSCVPDVSWCQVVAGPMTWLRLACDGIWDLIRIAASRRGKEPGRICTELLQNALHVDPPSRDNITALLVRLCAGGSDLSEKAPNDAARDASTTSGGCWGRGKRKVRRRRRI